MASGGSNIPPAPSGGGNKRLQQTQAQVDEVVDIMRVNVEKVLERDQKLSELDDRADALQAGASQFEASAGKLKRKFWWKNLKMMLILGAVVGVVVILFIVWIYRNMGGHESTAVSTPAQGPPLAPPQNVNGTK